MTSTNVKALGLEPPRGKTEQDYQENFRRAAARTAEEREKMALEETAKEDEPTPGEKDVDMEN